MPIKVILTLGFGGLLLYASVQGSAPKPVKLSLALFVTLGVYFVWRPDHTTVVANWLGVGRGTDLLIYIWILLSLVVGLNLHFKVRSARREITDLARSIALMTVRDPGAGGGDDPSDPAARDVSGEKP